MKNNSKKLGMKFEDKVQKCIMSGALWFDKADLKTDTHLIECKYTEKKSYSLTKKTLEKIWDDALDSNKLPVIVIGIKDNEEDWILTVNITRR